MSVPCVLMAQRATKRTNEAVGFADPAAIGMARYGVPMNKQHHRPSLLAGWNSAPNLVTYSRIVLVVAFLVLDALSGAWGVASMTMRWIAAVLFILAASTDKLDGWMARRYEQVTELGKLMDPIADKLLICSALLIASIFGELSWWVTALFLVREIGITVMRFLVIDGGGKVIAASGVGKAKTVTQCIGLAMLLVPVWSVDIWGMADADGSPGQGAWGLVAYFAVAYALVYIALVLCLYSGALYVRAVVVSRRRSHSDDGHGDAVNAEGDVSAEGTPGSGADADIAIGSDAGASRGEGDRVDGHGDGRSSSGVVENGGRSLPSHGDADEVDVTRDGGMPQGRPER